MQREYLVLRDLNADLRRRGETVERSRSLGETKNWSYIGPPGSGPVPYPMLEGDDPPVIPKGREPSHEPIELGIEVVRAEPEESRELERQEGVPVAELMALSHIAPVGEPWGLSPESIKARRAPVDEDFTADGTAWGVEAVRATQTELKGNSAVVAVLDTGITEDHAAFEGISLETQDYTSDGTIEDFDGHGTHCAATIFGRNVNGKRIGVASGVSHAKIGKIFGRTGRPTTFTLADAIYWAVGRGANVISISLSLDYAGLVAKLIKDIGLSPEQAASEALEEQQRNIRLFDSLMDHVRQREEFPNQQGAVVIAAAGNHSRRIPNPKKKEEQPTILLAAPPSSAQGVISTGAVRRGKNGYEMASFSNQGAKLVAPGVGIVSARNRPGAELISMNGTSMAAPHVAGLAALWWDEVQRSGGVRKAQTVIERLKSYADPSVFAPSVRQSDRGSGFARAPNDLMGHPGP